MDDETLARELNIPVDLVCKIAPERRAMYERLIGVADDLVLWQTGVGPRPEGVIVCRPHGKWSRP